VLDEDQLLYAMRSQVDVVLPSGVAVLNGDDPRVVPMAAFCNGEVMFFTRQPDSEAMASHLERGGRAVLIEKNGLRLQQGLGKAGSVHLLRISHIQCLRGSARAVHVAAAVGAAWALGLSPQLIEAAIETFETENAALLVA
jgi:cyanophycin synthetase